uniref:Protein cramped-like n=1 Tax=Phallusia mammillata TaxID=59560 RepID=A0A6F9D9D5_9ASCI|nr:protein cramped-like [Phallusia mammillata]
MQCNRTPKIAKTMRDASGSMLTTENDDVEVTPEDIQHAATDSPTPEKGRVWRRRGTTICSKHSDGPVLRATVKPVKRFQPDLTPGAISNQPPQLNAQVPAIKTNVSVVLEELTEDEIKTKPQSSSPQENVKSGIVKKKRVREQWSIDDKIHFFEAVAVHGKDFEAIQKTIAQKHKRKGDDSVIKTKDQVRHLYYRTWTTISKLIGDDVHGNQFSKALQELSAVINYGELWKRFGGYMLKKKEMLKLSELINYGSTSIRIKGKTYRIKTPTCKALKKIHDKEVQKSRITESRRVKLPLRVNVDLQPLTMEAWNKVHLLGHNPRLRFSIPMSCQLSQILLYLNKKWRSLSEKMFEVADYGQLQPNSSSLNIFEQQSSESSIEIHIPPDLPVKAKVKIHQVIPAKSHCIVSYAMCKLGKDKFVPKSKKKVVKPEEPPMCDNLETCNSSDEEFGVLEPVSDGEGVLIGAETNPEETDAVHVPRPEDVMQQTCLESDVCAILSVSESSAIPLPSVVDYSVETTPLSNAVSVEKNIALLATDSTPTDGLALELTDSQSSADSVLSPKQKVHPSPGNCSATVLADCHDNSKNVNETNTNSKSIKPTGQDACKSPDKSVEFEQQDTVTNNKDNTDKGVSDNVYQSSDNPPTKKSVENFSAHKPSVQSNLAVPRSWNLDNAADLTIAEVFLMLGKPGHFKLCYDWIKQETKANLESTSGKVSLSSGVTALVQTALLIKQKINKSIPEQEHATKNLTNSKNVSPLEKKTANASVQCNLIDKVITSTIPTHTTVSPQEKKHHGRGKSKFMMPESSFAVPNAPIARRRPIIQTEQIILPSVSDTSPNPEEIRQKVQERFGDVQFRRQMEALNRRRDLFRHQNRSRKSRKPYVVQRTMMPNDGAVRKMMTLSIVSCGSNKVGFAPQTTITTMSQPDVPMSPQTCEDVVMTSRVSPEPPADNTNDRGMFGEALGLKIPNKDQVKSPLQNVVAFAAEQSGVCAVTSAIDVSPALVTNDTQPSDYLNECDSATPKTDAVTNGEPNELGLQIQTRPITPSMDSLLDSININNSMDFRDVGRSLPLSLPPLDIISNSSRSSRPSSPLNPWMNVGTLPPSPCSFISLNTPQRIISDTEDSLDGLTFSPSKRLRLSLINNDSNSSISFPSALLNDTDMDLQLQTLLGDNSVELASKQPSEENKKSNSPESSEGLNNRKQ